MVKKSFIILVCVAFLFTCIFVPEASARKPRGGASTGDIAITAAIFVGVITAIGIIGGTLISHKKETKKLAEKTSTTEEDSEDIPSVALKF